MSEPRNPKNVGGPFYVLKGQCISCGAPPAEAPGLVTLDDDEGCYFHKQPETPAEVDDAIRAVLVSCIEAYRYGGTEPTIRRRLAERGYAHACDHPLEGHPVVVRNRARFALQDRDDATDVARLLVSAFCGMWRDGRCTRAVTGGPHRASFNYAAPYGSPHVYTLERVLPAATSPLSVYRDPPNAPVWLLAVDDERSPHIWLHDVLVQSGGVRVRWFSEKEWSEGASGTELPY